MNGVLAQESVHSWVKEATAPNASTSEIIDFASSIGLITIIVSQKIKLLVQKHK